MNAMLSCEIDRAEEEAAIKFASRFQGFVKATVYDY